MADRLITNVELLRRLKRLKQLYRWIEALQIIALATMGQYLYGGGNQKLDGKHWVYAREFLGGYQNVGLSLMIIAFIGFVGLISLAITEGDRLYRIVGWIFSGSAALWFFSVGLSHGWASATIPGAGSTGLWTLGVFSAGFFIGSRIAITILNGISTKELAPHDR